MIRRLGFAAALLAAFCAGAAAQESRSSTVGVRARIEQIVLQGGELIAKPLVPGAAIVLRIAAVYPHGTAFRYDFEYEGYEPGAFDLRDALVRKDGSAADDLPSIPVVVTSLLPKGQVRPHAPKDGKAPPLGGYRTLLWLAGTAWVVGLVALIFTGRKKRSAAAGPPPAPRTLADVLRPLVEQALAGALDRSERARLELALTSLWRKRLGLEGRPASEVYATLRAHADAGPLLRGLEDWLHRPSPVEAVDIPRLLAPYRSLPPELFTAATGAN